MTGRGMTPTTLKRRLHHEAYTVALLCPLEVELSAARYMLDEEHERLSGNNQDPNTYILGSLSGHNVVLASLPKGSQGTVSAATVAIHLMRTFPAIDLRLLVGIGGGIPSKANDIRLGDVVVSAPEGTLGGVVEYDLGKETKSGFRRKGILCPPPTEWRVMMTSMESDHRIRSNRIAEFLSEMLQRYPELEEYRRPPSERDILFPSDYIHAHDGATCASCDRTKAVQRLRRTPSDESHVFYGLIASGNRVMKDGEKRDRLARESGGAICCEMEAAGLMNQFQCVVIRGIADYCDSHKNDDWHAYAAVAAAALAKEILLYTEPRCPQPSWEYEQPLPEWKANVLRRLHLCSYRDAKNRNPQRVGGTCQWFTNHHLFRSWKEGNGSGLLWISADPGCGKSVLTRYLLDEILLSSRTSIVCYFFFKDDFEDQKSLVGALCCILHQIFQQSPRLFSDSLRSRFEGDSGYIYQSFQSLWSILCDLVKELLGGQVVCVLDALDECGSEEQSQLAECLSSFYQSSTAPPRLKVLITSRPYNSIQRKFQSLENKFPTIHLHGEDEHEVQKIAGEIKTVIEHRIGELAERLQLLAEERQLLLAELTAIPNRTYLWIHLIMDTLENMITVTPGNIRASIKDLPRTLDEAYDRILCRTPDPDRARRLLHLVVAASTPLSVADMATAMAVLERESPEDRLEIEPVHRFRHSVREMCGLFITIVDSRIYLLHQTAREFLVYKEGEGLPNLDLKWKASLNPDNSEWLLAEACVRFLYSTDPRMASKDRVALISEFNRSPFLRYSATNWSSHVLLSGIEDDATVLSQIVDILRRGGGFCLWFNDDAASLLTFTPSTPLMRASWLGLRSAVKTLLQDPDIDLNYRSMRERSALSLAAQYGNATVVELLLERSRRRALFPRSTQGIDVNEEDDIGMSPLAHAAYNGNESIVGLLLNKRGVRPDIRDSKDASRYRQSRSRFRGS
ncbi:purine and uridine phosphorylase [Aspergillus sclerotiicarbonarius CBS 121057]|uniref:Purine and uridine phosphorylase n=1 Tax=Aspergillus sclerotiicarbonarius (strain CBS 121057 / IBT 28362) TaxID=1448318 RepID=A0A319DX12_ASPSB|nr:purine and uridine phosphorylase [Aspergillus sclerotiicarbonarius CBS 121057]